jgi:hypothetical protein
VQETVRVSDICADGVSVLRGRAMPEGTPFVLVLPRRGSPVRVRCVVRHCRPSGPGAFAIGAGFVAFMR